MVDGLESIVIAGREHEALLDEFHAGLYLAEFAAQREPVEIWKARLWSGAPAPYTLTIRLVGHALEDPARRELLGGIAYEHYPRSGCGLVTYMVVAPAARRSGVGKQLIAGAASALHARGAAWVFGEVIDPRPLVAGGERDAAWRRLERNQRWGARVIAGTAPPFGGAAGRGQAPPVDASYVQPALAPGLARDRSLCLIALAPADGTPLPATIPGAIVADFVRELFACTEPAAPPDAELAALLAGYARSSALALVELAREWYP